MFDFSKKKIIITIALLPINISRGVLGTRVNPDTCRIRVDVQNSIWIRMGVDMEMLESGKKKLRIQKYPYTCGRGLRRVSIGLITMMLLWTLEISTSKKHVNIGMKLVCQQTEEDIAF